MVTTLDDQKRIAIASKLDDMKTVQSLLISSEQSLMTVCNDSDIRKRISDMLDDDRKNLGILETVMVQYGVEGEPKQTTQEMTKKVQQRMEGSELSLYEKFAQLELLNDTQKFTDSILNNQSAV